MSRSSKRIAHRATSDTMQEQREYNAEVANASRFPLARRRCHSQMRIGHAWFSDHSHCWHTRLAEGLQQQECCHCPAMRQRPTEKSRKVLVLDDTPKPRPSGYALEEARGEVTF